MVTLTLFSRERPRSQSPLSNNNNSSAVKQAIDDTEAKIRLYDRLSIKSPLPFTSHDCGSSSSNFSIRSLLKSQPRGGDAETTASDQFPVANAADMEPVIPSPAVFRSPRHSAGLSKPPKLPTVIQCATHLELLEAFWTLKHRVTIEYAESFDLVFGYGGRGARDWREGRGWGEDRLRKEVEWVESERERVWKSFVELAVQRFETWWTRMDAVLCEKSRRDSIPLPASGTTTPVSPTFDKKDVIRKWQQQIDGAHASSSRDTAPGIGNELPSNLLPPLDVLMVWYTYMLDRKTYYDNCESPSRNVLWDVAFPWSGIHAAIHRSDWSYKPIQEAQDYFTKLVGEDFDLFDSLRQPLGVVEDYPHPVHSETCPNCTATIITPISDPVGVTGWIDSNTLICKTCCAHHSRSSIIAASPLKIDIAKTVLTHTPFWDEIHRHLWICSPALSGKAYWGDVYIPSDQRPRPEWLQPEGTLERAITRLREFITSRGNVTSTSLPIDVELVWRTLAVSPTALAVCHPDLNGKRLIQLASCKQTNVDKKKHMMNAKRYGPAEWERCLCWTCEANRTEKDAAEKDFLAGDPSRSKLGGSARKELEAWEKVAMRRKVKIVVDWFAENEMSRREKRLFLLDKEAFAEELPKSSQLDFSLVLSFLQRAGHAHGVRDRKLQQFRSTFSLHVLLFHDGKENVWGEAGTRSSNYLHVLLGSTVLFFCTFILPRASTVYI